MSLDLPFEPITGLDSIRLDLPSFTLGLGLDDLESFLIKGFLVRRFHLRGRFHTFPYACVIRNAKDSATRSLLDRALTGTEGDAVYNGEAVGFTIDNGVRLFTRSSVVELVSIPDNTTITFVYHRPAAWNLLQKGQDLLFDVVYDEQVKIDPESSSHFADQRITDDIIWKLCNPEIGKAILQACEAGVAEQSRFGYSPSAMQVLLRLAIVYRTFKNYAKAEATLKQVLQLLQSFAEQDVIYKLRVQQERGFLYLDQMILDEAETGLQEASRTALDVDIAEETLLHIRSLSGLAEIALVRQLPQEAEAFITGAIQKSENISSIDPSVQVGLANQLSLLLGYQGKTSKARTRCRATLSAFIPSMGENHYQLLRTSQCLAKIMFDQDEFSETMAILERQNRILTKLLGHDHIDVLALRQDLALTYYKACNFDKCFEILLSLREKYEAVYGNHSQVAWKSLLLLSILYRDVGDLDAALRQLELLFDHAKSTKGLGNYLVRRVGFLLEDVYRRSEDGAKATKIKNELLSERGHSTSFQSVKTYEKHISQQLNHHLNVMKTGTCAWLLQNETFQAWVKAPDSCIIFLGGPPGSGKSVLTSFVIDHLQQLNLPVVYFYFQFNDDSANLDSFLRSFVDQIHLLEPFLLDGIAQEEIRELRRAMPNQRMRDVMSWYGAKVGQIYCCIDGLDECRTSIVSFMRNLVHLVHENSTRYKIFISCRPRPDIIASLSPKTCRIDIRDHSKDDLRMFIRSAVKNLPDTNEAFVDDLVNRSQGMFLWAKLSLDSVVRRLGNNPLPSQLYHGYEMIVRERISHLERPQKTLFWECLTRISVAVRPLQVNELAVSLAVYPEDDELDQANLILFPETDILNVCSPFIELLDDGSIAPIHHSFVDFLFARNSEVGMLPESRFLANRASAHMYFGKICISYLSFPSIRAEYRARSGVETGFVTYAALFWHQHAMLTGTSQSMLEKVVNFLTSTAGFFWIDQLRTFFGRSVGDLLFIQAEICEWAATIDPNHKLGMFVFKLYEQRINSGSQSMKLSPEASQVVLRFADVCQALGQFGRAQSLYEEGLIEFNQNQSPTRYDQVRSHGVVVRNKTVPMELETVSPDMTASWLKLAVSFRQQGRYQDAEKIQIACVESLTRNLSTDNIQTTTAMHQLAITYRTKGDLLAAEQLCRKISDILPRLPGNNDSMVMNSMEELAYVYMEQERYTDAQRIFDRLMERRSKPLGDSHPDNLRVAHNVDVLHFKLRQFNKAEECFTSVIERGEKLLGTEHPDVLDMMNNLANLYRLEGRLSEASRIYDDVLRSRTAIFGEKHPTTLSTMASIGIICMEEGNFEKAEAIYHQALAAYESDEHVTSFKLMNNLGNIYSLQGRFTAAKSLYLRAFMGYEKLLGAESMSTLETLTNLGLLYQAQGDSEEAEKLYSRALVRFPKVLGLEHPTSLHVLLNLGNTYANQSRFEQAEPLLRQALAGYRRVFGDEDTLTLEAANSLRLLLRDGGRSDEAEQVFAQASLEHQASHNVDTGSTPKMQNVYRPKQQYEDLTLHLPIDEIVEADRPMISWTADLSRQDKHTSVQESATGINVNNMSPGRRANVSQMQINRTAREFSAQAPQDTNRLKLKADEYEIAIVCSLEVEFAAACKMFDQNHAIPAELRAARDNVYSFGCIHQHNVIIARPGNGVRGMLANVSARAIMHSLLRDVPSVILILSVGIGGGAPTEKHNIRLGDTVVGWSSNGHPLVSFDHLKSPEVTSNWSYPVMPKKLHNVLRRAHVREKIDAQVDRVLNQVLEQYDETRKDFQRPSPATDVLFRSSSIASSSQRIGMENDNADEDNVVQRRQRLDAGRPRTHYGVIASGRAIIKDAQLRDKLSTTNDILCFEMEAFGLRHSTLPVIIRGISDYADSHKNTIRQNYAALSASAVAKVFLADLITKDLIHEIDHKEMRAQTESADS